MALYPCPECKREISTDAKACPHCGKGIPPRSAWGKFQAMPEKSRNLLGGILVILAAVIALRTCGPSAAKQQEAVTAAPQAAATAQKGATDGRLTVQPGQWFAFRDREMLERETKLAVQKDSEAWAKLMGQGAASGAIVKLKPGEEVFLEDTAVIAGLVKIRRKGETSGRWTNFEAVK